MQEWAKQGTDQRARQIRVHQKLLKKQYDKLLRSMQNIQLKQCAHERQTKLATGGEREIQMFMGKLSPPPTLWGVLPRSKARMYPWVMDMTPDTANTLIKWLGEGFDTAVQHGMEQHGQNTFHLRKGEVTVHVLQHSAERWMFGIQPVTKIADFLLAHPLGSPTDVRLTADPVPLPFTSRSDKLSQI